MVKRKSTCKTSCLLTAEHCLLAKVKVRWEEGNLPLRDDYGILRTLWNAIGKEGNFSTLQLTGVNLGAVNPEALADTARSALKIGFCDAGLTGEQTNALANALVENTKIEKVDLSDNSLTNIDPALLARAVARTKNLNLANAELSSHQLKEILEVLLSHDCVMNEINLSANEISMIDPDLMSKSLNKMTFVTLVDSNISVYQVWDQCFM